jgi:DNA-binding protein YbaB
MGKGPSNNMNQMLKQAQKMQDEITALQADLEQREFTGTAGGGVVEVTINGSLRAEFLSRVCSKWLSRTHFPLFC